MITGSNRARARTRSGRAAAASRLEAAAHGMSGQDGVFEVQGVYDGGQVLAHVAPGIPRLAGVCRKAREAMPPLIDHQDPQTVAQGFENGPVGPGIEAIGVGEDDVDRAIGRPELIGRGLAAPLRYGDQPGPQAAVVRGRHRVSP